MFAYTTFRDEFAGDFRGFGHFGGGRMGRGMIEPAILHTLLEKPMHGYEIISTLEEKSHGLWRPSAGSVYPTLQLLEEKGYVTADEADGKKTYTLTDQGKSEADKADIFDARFNGRGAHHGASFQEMRDVRELMGSMMRDMRTIYRKGSEDQRQKMYGLLANLRRELHTILQEKQDD